jgi:uncharacterized protein YbjQ (UPF0145 family)
MILSTTPNLEGKSIKEYKSIVVGETILGANFIRDIAASITDFIGGRSGAYEQALGEARDTAFQEMIEKAENLGANAIVGIDIDYETINQMLMVTCSGTAVIVE